MKRTTKERTKATFAKRCFSFSSSSSALQSLLSFFLSFLLLSLFTKLSLRTLYFFHSWMKEYLNFLLILYFLYLFLMYKLFSISSIYLEAAIDPLFFSLFFEFLLITWIFFICYLSHIFFFWHSSVLWYCFCLPNLVFSFWSSCFNFLAFKSNCIFVSFSQFWYTQREDLINTFFNYVFM